MSLMGCTYCCHLSPMCVRPYWATSQFTARGCHVGLFPFISVAFGSCFNPHWILREKDSLLSPSLKVLHDNVWVLLMNYERLLKFYKKRKRKIKLRWTLVKIIHHHVLRWTPIQKNVLSPQYLSPQLMKEKWIILLRRKWYILFRE